MSTSLSTFESKFNNDVGVNKNFKLWSQSLVAELINQAFYQVQTDGNFDWNENQASATLSFTSNEADLPSDFVSLTLVMAGTVNPEITTKNDLLKENNTLTTSGSPSRYYLQGGKLGLDTIPTSAVTIQYKKELPEITSSVESPFNKKFDIAIVKYAAYLAFSTYLPDDPRGALRLEQYNQQIESISTFQMDDSTINFSYSR